MVTRDLDLHVMGGRGPREIDDEVGAFCLRMRFSSDEAQAMDVYPLNLFAECTAANQSASN
jgi:hypothetical protein